MSDLQKQFDAAVAQSKQLPERPDNNTLLKLYALYKQGTSGEAEGARPGLGDLIGRAKYDAWAAIAGTSKEDAMRQYVDLIDALKD
ncbi:MAG: acyl-CoA-binding protein [Burkholderiales bacterium]|jgi:acyl-CoA-binding protein